MGDRPESTGRMAANLCDSLREVRGELGRLKAELQLVADGQGHLLRGDERERARRAVAALDRAGGELATAAGCAAMSALTLRTLAGTFAPAADRVAAAMMPPEELARMRREPGRYNGSPLPEPHPHAERAG